MIIAITDTDIQKTKHNILEYLQCRQILFIAALNPCAKLKP